jgi:hypothetical protein
MKPDEIISGDIDWKCRKCSCKLQIGKVTLKYMGKEFRTDLPRCPSCGIVLITEELATGRMSELEQVLEDK